jgi:hypothetical protein
VIASTIALPHPHGVPLAPTCSSSTLPVSDHPPVALAAFAAAGIARTGLWGVGLCAVKIAAAGHIIPYMFTALLLMIGSWGEIIYSCTACVGTVCLAGAQGCSSRRHLAPKAFAHCRPGFDRWGG